MLTTAILVVVTAFVVTQIAIFTTTIYLHRALTHKGVTFKAPVNAGFKFITWFTTGIRPNASLGDDNPGINFHVLQLGYHF